MSANVDQRIVQMQFDNQQFEAKAQNTITTLNALSQALQLPSSTKGFDKIQAAASRLDFSKLNQAIDTINYRFSNFGIMATRALEQVSDAAMRMGKRLVEAVTSQPISDGFKEYELKMDSVKRILNSAKNEDGTAVSLQQVNQRLDELNTYADKTIYSFSDMTQSIGKFTNAGVDLDTAVKAIQGISNEAALAGANTQEASRAMYNFAQALSVGYVKTIDWRSIELANMATTGFKDALVDMAVELGTVKKVGDEYVTTTDNMNGKTSAAMSATALFSDGLQYQWLTTDVLIKTLSRYSNETDELGKAAFRAATEVTTFSKLIDTLKEAMGSGWAMTWQLIIGDFNEAKTMWTSVNDVLSKFINTTAESRNEMLRLWNVVGGREALAQGLGNVWTALVSVMEPVKKAFDDVLVRFHTLWGQASFLSRMSKQFRDFSEGLKLNWLQQKQLEMAARGLFSAFDLLGQVVSAVFRTIAPMFGSLGEVLGIIAPRAAIAGQSFSEFVAHLKETDAIYNTLQKFVGILQKVGGVAADVFNKVLRIFGVNVEVEEGMTVVQRIAAIFEAFAKNPLVSGGIDMLGKAREAISGFFSGLKFSGTFQKVVDGLKQVGDVLLKIGGAIRTTVVDVISKLGQALRDLFTADDGQSFDLDRLFDAGALGAVTLLFKKLYDVLQGKDNPVSVIRRFFKDLSKFQDIAKDAAETFGEFADTITGPLKALQTSINAGILIKIATAIGILTASVWVLSRIDPGKLGVALFGIAALMGELTAAMAGMSKLLSAMDAGKMAAVGGTLVAFSVAIGILSVAVRQLSDIDPEKLTNGVIAVGILATIMTIMSRLGGMNLRSKGMIGLAASILILQIAVKRLGELETENLEKGMLAVSALIVLMGLFSKFGGRGGSAISMLGVAASILILKKAVEGFGELDPAALERGLGAVAGLIVLLGLFNKIAGKGMSLASLQTLAVTKAVSMLQKVVEAFGNMDTEKLGNGMLATAAALSAMAIALNLMKGTLPAAAALLVASIALMALVPAVKALTEVDFGKALGGIAALAIALGVMIVAGTALKPVIGVLLGFGAAVALIGVGVLALGVGLTAAAAGIVAFSGAMVTATAAVIAHVGMVVGAFIEAIPFIVSLVTKGFVSILQSIGERASAIVQFVVRIVTAIIDGLRELLPTVGSFIVESLSYIMQLLTDNMPTLTAQFVEMVITLIDGIALAIYENTDRLMEAIRHVLGAIVDFILATLQELLGHIPGIGGQISDAIQGLRDDVGRVMDVEEGKKIGSNFASGIAEGTRAGKDDADAAGAEVGESAKAGLTRTMSEIIPMSYDEWKGLPGMISGVEGETSDAAFGLGQGAVNSLMEGYGDLEGMGAYLPEGLAKGIEENQGVATDAGGSLMDYVTQAMAQAAEIESPSKVTWQQGAYLDEGLANGVTDNSGLITTAISGLGTLLTEGFSALTSSFASAGTRNGAAFAQGVTQGVAPARAAGSNIASSAVSALSAALPRFGQNGSVSGNAYALAVTNTSGSSRVAGSVVGTAATAGLSTARPGFNLAGVTSGTSYVSGVSSKKGAALQAGTGLGTSAASGAKNYSGFFSAGEDSSQGYLDGLLSKAGEIARRAADMVRNALDAARNAIDSHSPSRAYERLGIDSDQGYINGVEKRSDQVKSTLSTLATSAMGAFYEGLSKANDVATDELTVTPTVSPVMDMNNVYGGVDYLQGAFNGTGTVLGSIKADVSNNITDIRALVENTKQILAALNGRKPITIDGQTVIGWIDVELGSMM